MSIARIAVAAFLVISLGLAGCGVKGDPIRPGSEDDPKTKSAS